jgi:Uma2 family endonuclease
VEINKSHIFCKTGEAMTAAKKLTTMTIEEFETQYFETRCQFHEGEVWDAQATTPDHSYFQSSFAACIHALFNKTGGPKSPGGWWIFTEVAVRYSARSLFSHDLAGFKRYKLLERPKRFPITDRPDWVCEILSSNSSNDRITKKAVLHEHEVPYYWIVDPSERSINVMEWSEKGYVSILDVTDGFEGKIPPFDAVTLKANVLFGEEDE